MASLTRLTPSTSRVNCKARVRASSDSTKPLSCTVPLNVSTLIWCAFVTGSATRAAFTLAVTTPSSTACPADCCVGVLEQPTPTVEAMSAASSSAAVFLCFIMPVTPETELSLARAVATLFGRTLGGFEIAVRAVLTIALRVTRHRLALLRRDLVSRFGLRHGYPVVVLGGGLTGLLRLVGGVLGVIIRPCIGDVLLSIGHVFASVGLSIGDVARRIGPRLTYVMLHFGGRFCLVAADQCEAGGGHDPK